MTVTIDLKPGIKPSRDQAEQERLIAAVKAGDKDAWHKLLHMTPPVSPIDLETGEPAHPIPDEALRRENMYEDRV